VHRWGWKENLAVRDPIQEEIDTLLEENPAEENSPGFRREYLNEWVIEDSELVYHLGKENIIQELPTFSPDTTYKLSVDLGYAPDPTAFVLLAEDPHRNVLYVLDSYKQGRLIDEQINRKCLEYKARYAIPKIFIDAADLQFISSMRARWPELNLIGTEKYDKTAFIDLVNNDLSRKVVKIYEPNNKALIDEMNALIWKDEDRKKEHPAYSNHLCDAFLYGWRNSKHFNATQKTKTIIPDSEEAMAIFWANEANKNQHHLDINNGHTYPSAQDFYETIGKPPRNF
jgi:hypothetical protein